MQDLYMPVEGNISKDISSDSSVNSDSVLNWDSNLSSGLLRLNALPIEEAGGAGAGGTSETSSSEGHDHDHHDHHHNDEHHHNHYHHPDQSNYIHTENSTSSSENSSQEGIPDRDPIERAQAADEMGCEMTDIRWSRTRGYVYTQAYLWEHPEALTDNPDWNSEEHLNREYPGRSISEARRLEAEREERGEAIYQAQRAAEAERIATLEREAETARLAYVGDTSFPRLNIVDNEPNPSEPGSGYDGDDSSKNPSKSNSDAGSDNQSVNASQDNGPEDTSNKDNNPEGDASGDKSKDDGFDKKRKHKGDSPEFTENKRRKDG